MKKNGEEMEIIGGTHSERLKRFLRSKGFRGAGDVVHAVVQPVARSIDSVVGTNFQGCNKCSERKDSLNLKFPI